MSAPLIKRATVKSAAYFTAATLSMRFVEQLQAFKQRRQVRNKSSLFVLPISAYEESPVDMWLVGHPCTQLEPNSYTYTGSWDRWGHCPTIIQAISHDRDYGRRIFSAAIGKRQIDEAIALIAKCLELRTINANVFMARPGLLPPQMDGEVRKKLATPEALRPLQLYSVDGGKLAQLLLN